MTDDELFDLAGLIFCGFSTEAGTPAKTMIWATALEIWRRTPEIMHMVGAAIQVARQIDAAYEVRPVGRKDLH